MNKKGLYKIGFAAAGIIIISLVLAFVFLPVLSSQPLTKSNYTLGEKVKVTLPGSDVLVKIVTPSTSYVQIFSNSFVFQPDETGTYYVIFGNETYKFSVVPSQNSPASSSNITIVKSNNSVSEKITFRDNNPGGNFSGKLFSLSQNVHLEIKRNNTGVINNLIQKIQPKPAVHIYDSIGLPVSLNVSVNESSQAIDLNISKGRGMRPGEYKVVVNSWSGNYEETFLWGLISLNTLQSTYKTGDNATLEIVVLDANGRGVCNAPINLTIKNPSNQTSQVTNITGSPNDCGLYYAHYKVGEEGIYNAYVNTAVYGNNLTFQTKFLADNNPPYQIIRHTQSKIDPTKGNLFKVNVEVKPKNQTDMKIEEYVPSVFNITNTTAEISVQGNAKILSWDLNNSKDVNLSYSYSVPMIWPYLYELGPMKVNDYSEFRPWYVAVDPTYTVGGLCTGIITCLSRGSAVTCTCSEISAIDGTYLGGGLQARSRFGGGATGDAVAVINLSNSSLVPSSSTIFSANLYLNYYVSGTTPSSCTISNSTDNMNTWTTLDSDCTADTTQTTTSYDLSGLNQTQLDNFILNFTMGTPSGFFSTSYLYIDYANITVNYGVLGILGVNLTSPPDNSFTNATNVTFKYIPNTNGVFLNCSLWDNSSGTFSLREYNTSSVVNGTENSFTANYSSGKYIWNVRCRDNPNGVAFGLINYTLTVDNSPPSVTAISPADGGTLNSEFGSTFYYNASGGYSPIDTCSLIINGSVYESDSHITPANNQSFTTFLPNGPYVWSVKCNDTAGNSNQTSNRTVHINVPSYVLSSTLYETSKSSYTSTASIDLNSSQDATENNIAYTLSPASVYTLSNATSAFMGGSGAVLSSGTVTFSSVAQASSYSRFTGSLYLTWKLYIVNSSGSYLVCESGNDNTGGTQMTSTSKTTWTGTCTIPSDIALGSRDRLREVVDAYDYAGIFGGGTSITATHYWDAGDASYVSLPGFNSIGSISVNLTQPTSDRTVSSGESFNLTCDVNCSTGLCPDTNVYAQYNVSNSGWKNISNTGNLILGSGETNGHSLGAVSTAGNSTTFSIIGGTGISNIRCYASSSTSSAASSTIRTITVSQDYIPPNVTLVSPANNSNVHSEFGVNFVFNASDNNYVANCSIVLDNKVIYTNYSIVPDANTSYRTYVSPGIHAWYVKCYDASKNENQTAPWTLNVTQPSTNFGPTWYETYTSSFASPPALIYLNSSRDATENSVAASISPDTLSNVMNATSPYVGGTNGASISPGTVTFSAVTTSSSASGRGEIYLTWKAYTVNSAGDETLICESGNDANGGTAVTSTAKSTWTGTCNNPSEIHLAPTGKIKLVLDAYNYYFFGGNTVTFTHYWDAADNSYVNFADFFPLGNLTTNITQPTTDLTLNSGQKFNLTCVANCTAGETCENTRVYAQYNPGSGWASIGSSGNVVLSGGETNGHYIGNITSAGNSSTFSLVGVNSVSSVRCYATSDYSNSATSPVTRQINVFADTIPPKVNLLSPANNSVLDTSYGINLSFNATDNNAVANCSLFLDNQSIYTNNSIVNGSTTTYNNYIAPGIHSWYVKCYDYSGNMAQTPTRYFTSTFSHSYSNVWYETSSSSFSSPTALIHLNNTRDATENSVTDSLIGGQLSNVVNATSPYMGNNGGEIGAGTVTFSAVSIVSSGGFGSRVYLTWKAYVVNSSGGSTLICQSGNDNTGGTRVGTSKAAVTGTCNNPSAVYLTPTDKVKLVVDTYSTGTNTLTYYWDAADNSYVQFPTFGSVGNVSTDLVYPNVDLYNMSTGDQVNLTCQVNCSIGYCYNTQLYVQYNTSTINWINIGNTGNIILGTGESDPVNLGNVPSGSGDYNVTIIANQGSIDNIRCIAESDHSSSTGPTTRKLAIAVGQEAPVITLSTANDTWFNITNVTLYYSDNDVNNNIANSTLFLNGKENQTNQTPIVNGGGNSFALSGLSEGKYNWSVSSEDTTDLIGSAGPYYFYIDTQKPTVTLDYPASNASISSTNLNVTLTATDNLSPTDSCKVLLDGSVVGTSFTVQNNTATNRTIRGLSPGTYFWNVTCSDLAGNTNTSETRNFTVSAIPPTIDLVTPNMTAFTTGTINLTYYAVDFQGFKSTKLILNRIVNQTNQTIINNGGENNFTVTGLADGYYNWSVNGTNVFDLNASSGTGIFIVDKNPPVVTLDSPANSSVIHNSTASFNFTATDDVFSSLDCNLTVGASTYTYIPVTSGVPASKTVSGLQNGPYPWYVMCWNPTGNSGYSQIWYVNVSQPPNVTLVTPNESYFNTSTVELQYTPEDNTGFTSCNLYINGTLNQTQSTISNYAVNNFTVSGMNQGYYNWNVLCTDTVGLTNQTKNQTFGVDLSVPQIYRYKPVDNSTLDQSNVSFIFNVTDSFDPAPLCNLTVNGANRVTNFTANSSQNTTEIVHFSIGGMKYWQVTCKDIGGNTNSSTLGFFNLSLPPWVNLTNPLNGGWANTSSVLLSYNVSDSTNSLRNSSLYFGGSFNELNQTPLVNNQINNFTVTGLSEGYYNWSVSATNALGLTGYSNTSYFHVDTVAPHVILNNPNGTGVVTWKNITFNFTAFDNMAPNMKCNLSLDNDQGVLINQIQDINVANNSDSIDYSVEHDGNYSWYVDCKDLAGNINTTNKINFTVKAPPIVVLDLPPNGNITASHSMKFTYTPKDPLGLTNCSLYIDDFEVNSSNSIFTNQPNNFSFSGISQGFNNWTVGCTDPDNDTTIPTPFNFTVDNTPPRISLDYPANNSGIYYGSGSISFKWTPNSTYDPGFNDLNCSIYVDGSLKSSGIPATSGLQRSYGPVSLSVGEHNWNAACTDIVGNTNTTGLAYFNFTYPDFMLNSSSIVFNNTNPKENQTVRINVTAYNIGGANTSGVIVDLYNASPSLGGKLIGSKNITVLSGGQNTTSFYWNVPIGTTNIYAALNPGHTYTEWSYSNNNQSKNITVSSWQFFYGDISPSTNYTLRNNASQQLSSWSSNLFSGGDVFLANSQAVINWANIKAIGKTTSGSTATNDFSDIDTLLNMTGYQDSVESVYGNGTSTPTNTTTFNIYGVNLTGVPIADSINNSNFTTGILWDSSGDTDGQFDTADKENLVFVSKIHKNTKGTFGTYDYEIRVPARLRSYPSGSISATFYLQLE